MGISLITFVVALMVLLLAANYFTKSAEQIGAFLKLPAFVIGIFIVGIGTSLPELISGIFSVKKGVSEILTGNVMGANISNILLITGLAVVVNRKNIVLNSTYLYIDLHFLLGSFIYYGIIVIDGSVDVAEAFIGIIIYLVYSIYLIKGGNEEPLEVKEIKQQSKFPVLALGMLGLSAVGIYFGAEYTVNSLEKIAQALNIPNAIISLTLLSLGTTLPELAVNISAIRQGKAEMAIGNILGSCVFNTLVISGAASFFGEVKVPSDLLNFSLPIMAVCGLFFYLLTQDKKISVWEGLLFICLYVLFIVKTAGI